MTANKLRLGPLPKTETVKITISLSVELKAMLDRYASLLAQAHGEPVDATALVPHMLEAFMARDRGFRALSRRASPSEPSTKNNSIHFPNDGVRTIAG